MEKDLLVDKVKPAYVRISRAIGKLEESRGELDKKFTQVIRESKHLRIQYIWFWRILDGDCFRLSLFPFILPDPFSPSGNPPNPLSSLLQASHP